MLEFLKNYYVFMLILMVLSYLVPKEDYKNYIQFFIGIFVVALFLKPVLEFFSLKEPTRIFDVFESFNQKFENLDLEIKEGQSIFEYFFFKGERE